MHIWLLRATFGNGLEWFKDVGLGLMLLPCKQYIDLSIFAFLEYAVFEIVNFALKP